jgi:hypothetical protein
VKSIDFDPVARHYDLYVRTELDVPFWVEADVRNLEPLGDRHGGVST